MNPYITETEYAVKNLIILATKEDLTLEELKTKLAEAEAKFKIHKWDFQTSDLNDDFSDAYVMAAFHRMAKTKKAIDALQNEVNSLQALIGTKQSAIQAICGAILQISKQGISFVHGSVENSPGGRYIGTIQLRDIIWQSRNQAIHSEECSFRKPIIQLFSTLEAEQGVDFSLTQHPKQSRAKQVIKLLGWTSYEKYSQDMKTLLP